LIYAVLRLSASGKITTDLSRESSAARHSFSAIVEIRHPDRQRGGSKALVCGQIYQTLAEKPVAAAVGGVPWVDSINFSVDEGET
jgi:hypothetical protein